MSYYFGKGVPRTIEERAAAHAELGEEIASWSYVPPEARFLFILMEHFGGALDVLQAPSQTQDVAAFQEHPGETN